MDGKVGDDVVGTVKAWCLMNIPYGWLECNGQPISRTTYSELFNKFENQYTYTPSEKSLLSVYGIGDGNTTFNLPDYCEVALVGMGANTHDKNAGLLQTDDFYHMGQFQDDQFQNHTHFHYLYNHEKGDDTGGSVNYEYGYTLNDMKETTGASDSFRYGNVTRGKRKGVKFIIKVL